MNEPKDPMRWLEGGEGSPQGFAELLGADEAAQPDAAQLMRVLDGVASRVSQPALSQALRAQSTAAPAGLASAGVWAKLALGICSLMLAVGAWLALRRDHTMPARPGRAPVEQPSLAQPEVARATPPQDAPALSPPTAAEAAVGEPSTPAARADAASAVHPHRPLRNEDPTVELSLLESAQRALRDDPKAALALTDQHRVRFARGQFVEEREMLAIEALLHLGRGREAKLRARVFRQRHPGSSHLPRLTDLLRSTP